MSTPQSIWAIVPVKTLHNSKRRLAHILSPSERADLIHQFLVHTLHVLGQSPGVDRILVVSSDMRVLATAEQHNAAVLLETAVIGLNSAVTQAAQYAAAAGATAVLILPADLPFIQAEDVAIMVKHQPTQRNMIICPDEKGLGTNALFITPPTAITFRFGVDSFYQHLQEAAQQGLAASVIHVPGLRFDLDTEADWRKYQLTIRNEQFTI